MPHFHERYFPLVGHLSSRDVVRGIFQWYRMLSPKIEIEIDTVCTLAFPFKWQYDLDDADVHSVTVYST